MSDRPIPKEYMWLLDYCGFYKGEDENPFQKTLKDSRFPGTPLSNDEAQKADVSSMFWYYEECWVKFTINWECGFSYCNQYLRDGLEDFLKDNGTPISLKALLHNRFFHWSGGYDTVEDFKKWYMETYEKYRDRSHQEKLTKGRQILNEYRLEFLMYKADYQNMVCTPEMDYRFSLVDCVDAIHTYESEVSEKQMCRALERASEHGLTIEVVPTISCEDRCDGWSYIADYKEIRAKALGYLQDNVEVDDEGRRYDTIYLMGFWGDRYVYCLSSSERQPGDPSVTGLPKGLIVDGDNIYIIHNLIEISSMIEDIDEEEEDNE